MKPPSRQFCAAVLLLAGLLAVLAGCANAPIRQSRLEANLALSFTATDTAVQQAPIPVVTVAPVYPTAMRRSSISGVVNVTCLVDEDGGVREATVQSTTDNGFNQAAVAAVRQWTFQPARRDGIAVPVRVNIPIRFTFKES